MNDISQIYSQQILHLCSDVPRQGRIKDAHGSATCHARLCGSTITVDVKLEEDCIADFAHEIEACALGRAAASYLARHAIGKNLKELKALQEIMHAMLESDGTPPKGEWSELKIFENVRHYPSRHASTLLTFDATVAAMEQAIENLK